MNPVGAHFSIGKGFLGAMKEALNSGADAMQIFAKNPMAAKYRSVHEDEAREISEWKDRGKIRAVFIHASYLINPAREMDEKSFPYRSLHEDLKNIDALQGTGVVLHMGKTVEIGAEKAEKTFIENIKKLAKDLNGLKAKIIIENTAGAGTEMGWNFEEIGKIYKKIGDSEKVKICLDTAHSFGAGYDWRDPQKTEKALKLFDKEIGFQNLACIHLNDSKKLFDSHSDRHADIGTGEIGEEGLKNFVKTAVKMAGKEIPFILETPEESESYKKQIEKVRSWLN